MALGVLMRFAFAFAFALAACGELEPVETDAGPEVDAGLVEDVAGGACQLLCVENDLVADWQQGAGPPADFVTCCDCRRAVYSTPLRDICVDSIVSGDRVDGVADSCATCDGV